MLKYIAEKNGMTYKETSRKNGIGYATVTNSDNVSVTFTGEVVNNQIIINSADFAKMFGIESVEKVTHQSGDLFDSESDVIMAFGLKYNQKSVNTKSEFGASINKNDNGYFFGPVDQASEDNPNHVSMDVFPDSIGTIHTHWKDDGSLNFSESDRNIMMKYKEKSGRNFNYYIENRDGQIRATRYLDIYDYPYPEISSFWSYKGFTEIPFFGGWQYVPIYMLPKLPIKAIKNKSNPNTGR